MWQPQAEALFFMGHNLINDIAVSLGKSRETISRYLCKHPDYQKERVYRKERSADKRMQYQRAWDAANRSASARVTAEDRYGEVTAETIRIEHDIAVRILSRERI